MEALANFAKTQTPILRRVNESRCFGMRGDNRTLHGLALDEIKSAIQKYARRGMLTKGVHVLMDAELFALLPLLSDSSTSFTSNVKAVRTNFVNRILICSVEDCLQPGIYVDVYNLYRAWDSDRDGIRGMTALVKLYATVALSRKGRMVSICKLLANMDTADRAWQRIDGVSDYLSTMSTNSTFGSLLLAGDLRCVKKISSGAQNDTAAAERIWDTIFSVHGARSDVKAMATLKALKSLWQAKKKHAESILFLYQAIVLTSYRNRVTSWSETPDVSWITEQRVAKLYRRRLEEDEPITLDDFCLDMHTRRGRAAGKTSIDFALSGSNVTNEDVDIVPEDLSELFKRMYVASKYIEHGRVQGEKRGMEDGGEDSALNNEEGLARRSTTRHKKYKTAGEIQTETEIVSVGEASDFVPLLPRTCGMMRPMTYSVTINYASGLIRRVAMKPGCDLGPVAFDVCKPLFGLLRLNTQLVRAAVKFETSASRKGQQQQHRIVKLSGVALQKFWVTDLITTSAGDPAPMASQAKAVVQSDKELVAGLCKIAMVRWLFGIKDFTPRNVLFVAESKSLYSIDEDGLMTSDKIFSHVTQVAEGLRRFPSVVSDTAYDVCAIMQRGGFERDLRSTLSEILGSSRANELASFVMTRGLSLGSTVVKEMRDKLSIEISEKMAVDDKFTSTTIASNL